MRYLIYFNPRSHERSDGLSFSLSSNPVNFNPRSHERSDHLAPHITIFLMYFNPRSHERSDQARRSTSLHRLHFNPRSHERSDLFQWVDFVSFLFQSTLPREERLSVAPEAISEGISIHAPTRGATEKTFEHLAFN